MGVKFKEKKPAPSMVAGADEAAAAVQIHKPHGQTTVKHSDGSETTKDYPVPKNVTTGQKVAYVGLRASKTVNMGKYESIKLEVSLTYPVVPDNLEEGFKFVEGWVDAKMQGLLEGLEQQNQS